jgi:hypothetical protein
MPERLLNKPPGVTPLWSLPTAARQHSQRVSLILDSSLLFYAQASLWKIVLSRLDLQRLNGFAIYLTDFTERKMIFIARTAYLIFKEQKP